MVQLQHFSVLILLLLQRTNSQLDFDDEETDESKKIILKTNKLNFHCDLHLLPQQKKIMYLTTVPSSRKYKISFDLYKWPKNKEGFVIVPYYISRNSHFSSEQIHLMRYAMDAVEQETCIRFRERKYEKDFVNIFAGKYCKSNLGRTGGGQELSLNKLKCMQKGIIIHELLHALGYIHEHNRPDRDKYVKILWQNIDPKWYKEFDRVSPTMHNTYGTSYDYHSIMHYGAKASSRNGLATIVPREEQYLNSIGQRGGLSVGDIQRINNKYHCNVKTPKFINYGYKRLNSDNDNDFLSYKIF
ncbi:CLUMA_CG003201, isoform A [Clunio marinus]|uniref:Metalloendopeptidase n=1 Tax=Clunio marinus TaxID=568069 RepID=A0A1J1HPY9_9DIPT|nr:CLUMA_CG003201, isoform A [Clunio marinus]